MSDTPWMPGWLSFLSGLPTERRRRIVIVPMQAFVDDSGGKGQGSVFVLAGYIGSAEEWDRFSNKWIECLATTPTLSHLSMRKAAARRGELERWTEKMRNEKLRALAEVVAAHKLTAIYTVLDLPAFKDFVESEFKRPFSDPYFFSFHAMIIAVMAELQNQGLNERFEIIFDEQDVHGQHAKKWFPVIRRLMSEEDQRMLPVDPVFRSDKDAMPLQAADMLAWMVRRSWSGQHTNLAWLGGLLGRSILMSKQSQVLDRSRIHNWITQSYTEKVVARLASLRKRGLDKP